MGNGATWGRLKPKTKIHKKKVQKIFKFWILVLILNLSQDSFYFPLLGILKNYVLYVKILLNFVLGNLKGYFLYVKIFSNFVLG